MIPPKVEDRVLIRTQIIDVTAYPKEVILRGKQQAT